MPHSEHADGITGAALRLRARLLLHHLGSVHLGSVHLGSVHLGSVHLGSVHLGSAAGALLLCMLAAGCESPGQRAASSFASNVSASDTSEVYGHTTPSRNGTGKVYMGREIAEVMGHRGADWLERSERAPSEMPGRVVQAMNLQPSDVVADVGAGTGYFTFRLAPKVPRGTVYAVDIQPEMLARIRRKMEARDVDNIEPIRGTVQNPNVPGGRVDAALMVDAYHEFSYPREMMLAIKEALRPGGRVYLVEYRKEDPTIPIKPLHKMTEKQAIREMRAAGLRHRETRETLPRQHLMIFEKPVE